MSTLVVGANGATGRLLVDQLLHRGEKVKAVVRSPDRLPAMLQERELLSVIYGGILDFRPQELAEHLRGCTAVASCLGHPVTWKGIFGPPRRLVTDAVRRLCDGIRTNDTSEVTKFVLMNTAGNRNRDLNEPVTVGHSGVIWLLRRLVPPHADNEQAADYLRTQVGQENPSIEWTVVRPDSLLDAEDADGYEVYPSPTRSAIFNPGKTSRTHVAHFMADLITREDVWSRWKGQMPVLYSRSVS
jgi:nucleoside-diphosphate-sugar epimerase